MSTAATFRSKAAPVPRQPRAYDRELWLSLPKGGRTLGGSDATFLQSAGFTIADKVARTDDFRLVDGPEFAEIGVRAFEMKPQMALGLLATGRLDVAVVGRDVVKEFNLGGRGKKGAVQAVELVDLDLAPCVLTIAVPETEVTPNTDGMDAERARATVMQSLNGRYIVTKYPLVVENWARANRVRFAGIISTLADGTPISGGIESYPLFDPRATAVCDIVESGESLVRYELKPFGITDETWTPIRDAVLAEAPKKERPTFIQVPNDARKAIPGVVLESSALLVRPSRKMSPPKEAALATLIARFTGASQALGRSPDLKTKRVADQTGMPSRRRRKNTDDPRAGEIGHAAALRL